MQDIPQNVIDAARLIEVWANEQNLETARIGRVCFVRSFEVDAEPAPDEWCDDYHCPGDCGMRGHGYQHS